MAGKRVRGAVAMVAALLSQSGCSFLFVNGPPANHAQLATFDCSDGYGWPVFDAIWAGLNGLGAASAKDEESGGTTTDGPSHDQVVAVGVSWLVVSGISAIYGFSKVSACREAKHRRELAYMDPAGEPARRCRDERARAVEEASHEKDQSVRMRMIGALPVCTPSGVQTTPSAAPTARAPAAGGAAATSAPAPPAPGTTSAPGAARAPAPAAVPSVRSQPVPAPTSTPAPTSSRLPALFPPQRYLRTAHARSLAMRLPGPGAAHRAGSAADTSAASQP